MRPLDGIVVLDLTRLLPGAVATMLLYNFGAEVIKVEEPERGDYARGIPPLVGKQGAIFLLTNWGKKSVAINLKDPRGKDAFLQLVTKADVLIEGFRPGVMDGLGLGYEVLRVRNKRLIYAAITGYGQSGPYADLPGHDINYLSLSGVLDAMRTENGPPGIPGIQIADLFGGAMNAVIGVLLAISACSRTGLGQVVDVSIFEGIIPLLATPLSFFNATGTVPGPGRLILTGLYACYNVYQARDGRWLSVGALEPKFWATLCHSLGCEQLIPDQFAEGTKQAEVITTLTRIFKTRDAREWFSLLSHTCVTPVVAINEVVHDPHLRDRRMILAVKDLSGAIFNQIGITPRLSETASRSGAAPPRLGEHTREVLLWAGLSASQIEQMEREQLIRTEVN